MVPSIKWQGPQTRDTSILGILLGRMRPMGIPWEWESQSKLHRNGNRNGNGFMGTGGNENSTFSHFQSEKEKQPVSGATSASPGPLADSDILDYHSPPAKKRRVCNFSVTQKTINSKAAMNWHNMST